MKVAVLSDIHSNYFAFEACYAEEEIIALYREQKA